MDKRIKYDLNSPVIKHGLVMMAQGTGGVSRTKHTLRYFQQHGYPQMNYSSVYFLFKRALKYDPQLRQWNAQYHHRVRAKVQDRRRKRAEARKQAHEAKVHQHNLFKREVKEAHDKTNYYHQLDQTNQNLLNKNADLSSQVHDLRSQLTAAKSTTKQQDEKLAELRTRVAAQDKRLGQLGWVNNLKQVGTGTNKLNQRFSLLAIVRPNQSAPLYAILSNGQRILMWNPKYGNNN